MTGKVGEILDATDEPEFKSKCSELVSDLGHALCGLGHHRTGHAEKNAVIVGKVSGIKGIGRSDPDDTAEFLRLLVAELEPAESKKIAEQVALDCTSFLIAGLWIAGERGFHSIKESCEKLLLWLANNAVPQEFFTALCEAYTAAGINRCAIHTARQVFELMSIIMHRIARKHHLFFDAMKLIGDETVSSAPLASSDQLLPVCSSITKFCSDLQKLCSDNRSGDLQHLARKSFVAAMSARYSPSDGDEESASELMLKSIFDNLVGLGVSSWDKGSPENVENACIAYGAIVLSGEEELEPSISVLTDRETLLRGLPFAEKLVKEPSQAMCSRGVQMVTWLYSKEISWDDSGWDWTPTDRLMTSDLAEVLGKIACVSPLEHEREAVLYALKLIIQSRTSAMSRLSTLRDLLMSTDHDMFMSLLISSMKDELNTMDQNLLILGASTTVFVVLPRCFTPRSGIAEEMNAVIASANLARYLLIRSSNWEDKCQARRWELLQESITSMLLDVRRILRKLITVAERDMQAARSGSAQPGGQVEMLAETAERNFNIMLMALHVVEQALTIVEK
ncbi:hypothetical protein NDN08_002614 [Rhodosorus marinus]|uniref:Nuclear pore complex protein Nup85 n=1 Tax=Rhodosorus marinus TaxID=101924 RepID=A0AAV8UU86_9RHOD|nr:hypothetical protein NDN08_002614 [Rhodosorus marinus]